MSKKASGWVSAFVAALSVCSRALRKTFDLRPVCVVGLWGLALTLGATSIIPITDQELYRRADVVVHGVVVSSDVTVDELGRPETLTVIEPLAVLKGRLPGSLVLHQLGGTLPDGRSFKLWGRPEYVPGREVVVFAIARAEGDFQTAELLLGKFEVWHDEAGNQFAVPDLAIGVHPGLDVYPSLEALGSRPLNADEAPARAGASTSHRISSDGAAANPDGARELSQFFRFLRAGASGAVVLGTPVGKMEPVKHSRSNSGRAIPLWGNISDQLWRWNNGATAAWTLVGTANITGGGTAEATAALATWTNDPNSTINYTVGSGNTIDLNAMTSSGCGWSTCLSGAGVIGCGGPSGGGSHVWRGDTYITITQGFVQLRSYCTFNGFSSTITQSVLTHELGHTLGLGHSDQNFSPHDVCTGDESLAIMFSTVQNRTTLGTDDQDAIRWIYGDGSNSCAPTGPPVPTGITPSFGSTSGGSLVTIVGSAFQSGAAASLGGVAATGVTVVNSTTITATTGAHAAGTVDVVVTNPDAQSGTLTGGFTYSTGAAFFTVTPCRVADTRNPDGPLGGPALVANADRTFVLAGQCGIPATAKAASINVTITQPTAQGDLRLYPSGAALPLTSVINYRPGQTRANNSVAPLGASGGVAIHCDQASGNVHLIIDVNGYFQ